MQRRDAIRSLFLGAASAQTLLTDAKANHPTTDTSVELPVHSATRFTSQWHLYDDMPWTGEDLWAQRLQDWSVKDGELHCLYQGIDRAVHLLTHQLSDAPKGFTTNLSFRFLSPTEGLADEKSYAGWRLGLKGRFPDYRSAIFTGKGFHAGVTRTGILFIGDTKAVTPLNESVLTSFIRLTLSVVPLHTGGYTLTLNALNAAGKTLATLKSTETDSQTLTGTIAIVSHFTTPRDKADQPSIAIKTLDIQGEKLAYHPTQTFGPVYFAQYTVHAQTLKLTAQLAPIDKSGDEVVLYVKRKNKWLQAATSAVHPLARTATFVIRDWQATEAIPYKVVYLLRLKNGKQVEYAYQGTIAAEPVHKDKLKALAFSCNWDYGFPDNEVVTHAALHKADMAFFLGDQFYEPNGGFGTQMNPLEKSTLDYLRKWYMFGWSYRDLFRHIPMAALPDDHDVYHGNIWGAGGRPSVPLFGGANSQDSGGYKMPAEWVNMAQLTQTSHMPDPFDAKPALQGMQVYYTHWQYGGLSFGIIEDRKFKSPPKEILPPEAEVWNGFVKNNTYDRSKEKQLEAQLIGERQLAFLESWVNDPSFTPALRILVSATPFCCLQTLPATVENDQHNQELPIPEKGTYLTGDVPVRDMDSNGWPHNRRDEVLKLLGKKVHLHLTGDQHLPSVVQYGVESFGDSMYCFAVPALCSIWPRRWWPSPDKNLKPIPGKPAYAGNFLDGFDNKITVHAVANPHRTGKEPAVIYDRIAGYGILEFDKKTQDIQVHCWPRHIHPIQNPDGQYEGWPIRIG